MPRALVSYQRIIDHTLVVHVNRFVVIKPNTVRDFGEGSDNVLQASIPGGIGSNWLRRHIHSVSGGRKPFQHRRRQVLFLFRWPSFIPRRVSAPCSRHRSAPLDWRALARPTRHGRLRPRGCSRCRARMARLACSAWQSSLAFPSISPKSSTAADMSASSASRRPSFSVCVSSTDAPVRLIVSATSHATSGSSSTMRIVRPHMETAFTRRNPAETE